MSANLVDPEVSYCWRYGYKPLLGVRVVRFGLLFRYYCPECGVDNFIPEAVYRPDVGELQAALDEAASYWNDQQTKEKAEFDKLVAARYNTYE